MTLLYAGAAMNVSQDDGVADAFGDESCGAEAWFAQHLMLGSTPTASTGVLLPQHVLAGLRDRTETSPAATTVSKHSQGTGKVP